MKKLLRPLLLLLAVLTPLPALAQGLGTQIGVPLVSNYSLTGNPAALTYCAEQGQGGVLGAGIPVNLLVTTSGSSTTITAVTAADAPFASIAVGDELVFNLPGNLDTPSYGETFRVVTARASASSLTVNTAIDLSTLGNRSSTSTTFRYRKRVCGTAATSGWVPVRGFSSYKFTFQLDAVVLVSGGVSWQVECIDGGTKSVAITIYQPAAVLTTTTATDAHRAVILKEPWSFCRVGFSSSGNLTSTDMSVWFEGRKGAEAQ